MDSILSYERHDDEDFYAILGCDETANADQILAEFRVRSLQHHPDKNPDDKNAVLKFQKLLKAKETLCDPEKRAEFDKWRRSGFSIPFEQFLNLNKSAHTSMHWVCKKKKDLMLEEGDSPEFIIRDSSMEENEKCAASQFCRRSAWERDPACDLLKKFRNYEI